MTMLDTSSLRPINPRKGLPRLLEPTPEYSGIIEYDGKFTKFQYTGSDRPSNIVKGNFQDYHKDEILYTVNSHYFRADEFDKNNPGIMSLGCSHTYGTGLRDNETWPYLLSKHHDSPNWNLGCASMGPDYCHYVAKQFFEEEYIPKVVAIMWPSIYRKILVIDHDHDSTDIPLSDIKDASDFSMPYVPNVEYDQPDHREFRPLIKSMQLSTFEDNFIRFWHHRDSLITLCKMHNVPYIEMLPQDNNNVINRLQQLYNEMPPRIYFTLNDIPLQDPVCTSKNKARDGLHFGAHVHELIANEFAKLC